ncbi:MAG: hypothetical protein ACOX5X_04420 [Acholeplasmataceae bacterium]|jgi:uncharacterized membrane protein YjgN (DUF898 family)
MEKKSTFIGSNWNLIWRTFVLSFGVAITLFIATPWLLSWYLKWYFDQVIVDGKKLRFDGEGKDLMETVYILILLSIVTFGIATLFMMAWTYRRMMQFVHFEELVEE